MFVGLRACFLNWLVLPMYFGSCCSLLGIVMPELFYCADGGGFRLFFIDSCEFNDPKFLSASSMIISVVSLMLSLESCILGLSVVSFMVRSSFMISLRSPICSNLTTSCSVLYRSGACLASLGWCCVLYLY